MSPALLLLPFAVGVWNRYGRGEGNVPRWAWYGSMIFLASLLDWHDLPDRHIITFAAVWLLFLVGYAMVGWSPLISAGSGSSPRQSKDDGFIERGFFRLSCHLLDIDPDSPNSPETWHMVGILFGAMRASLMQFGVIGLTWYYRSWVPLIGLAFLGIGYVYYAAGVVVRHLRTAGEGMEISDTVSVPLAEFTVGYLVACYMMICGSL